MTLYLDDGDVRLYHGDALETLRSLPDGCVDMVATSPPFYGLRDYGTGTWEGGNPDCDHSAPRGGGPLTKSTLGPPGQHGGQWHERTFSATEQQFRETCGKCGARRVDRQIGLEETPDQWVNNLVQVFRECRRVLADHGTLWVEIGDSYGSGRGAGVDDGQTTHARAETKGTVDGFVPNSWGGGNVAVFQHPTKPKDLLGQPWLLAFALRADGWYLRSEIIWARPNPMPESVTDRPTKSHSTIFLLSKQPRYFYDADAIREPLAPSTASDLRQINGVQPTRGGVARRSDDIGAWKGGTLPAPDNGANARSVWTIPTQPTPFAHFATWPQKLVARMIQAGTSERGKCAECGKPWVRKTERPDGTQPLSGRDIARTYVPGNTPHKKGDLYDRANPPVPVTIGWEPSCNCPPEGHLDGETAVGAGLKGNSRAASPIPIPCTVLDPFAGSGTTLLVARHHGRHAIGIELNEAYCKIAAEQLQQLSLLT